MSAIVAALFGLLPRIASAGWAVYGAVVFITFIGAILRLGQWFMDRSPFTHVPNLPGGGLQLLPLVTLSAAAAVLAILGMAASRRRNVG